MEQNTAGWPTNICVNHQRYSQLHSNLNRYWYYNTIILHWGKTLQGIKSVASTRAAVSNDFLDSLRHDELTHIDGLFCKPVTNNGIKAEACRF